MRLFGYYAWHSFVNQLRKLFKTWVLIFLVICMAVGALIGVGAAMLDDASGEDEEIVESEIIEEEPGTMEKLGIEPEEFVELIVGGIILVVFVFQAISADKNGSKIFLPADVNLLFSSPMKPQSVLLFRLMTQLGTSILASVYLLFQLPNLVLNLGLSIWVALAMIATWCLTIVIGKLLQILLYIVCSTNVKLKSHLRNGIYVFLLVIAGAYLLYWKTSGEHYMVAATGFFNGSVSRFIPLWGWLKGFCMFAIEGNIVGLLVSFAAIVVGGSLLTYIIWHIKADFYEDAMAKSEETAELLAAAQSAKGGVTVIRRKKDRSDKLHRDGMRHGSGANVFFHKAMYNRFRFAHLGIFTKTSETYLVAAIGTAVLCRFVIQTNGLIPIILTLGALTFFRAMGNPLEQDTQMDHFLLIPESTWHKLFWSLLGGTANCFLDLLPAVIVSALLLGENVLLALAWLPLIVSVDFFATTVGAFIGFSVPVSAGKMVKQLVQIMFIYFGLLPDVAIMAVGLTFDQPVLAAIGCTVINVLLGLVFFFLSPLFLEPKDGKKYAPEKPFTGDLKKAKNHFSKLGIGTFAILGIGTVTQLLLIYVVNSTLPQVMEHSWGMWLLTFAPLYLIAVPIGLLLLRKVPAKPLEKHDLKPSRYIVTVIICIFMMYAGNILGTIITALLQLLPGVSAGNPILGYATDNALLPKVLFMVILAPVIEEYIFRKQLIDRMHIYGEKLAVVTSALMFGLFHGNLSQFFYAFALGLVFGYVYLKTGKLRYSIGLHMLINLLGSVVGPFFLEKVAVVDTMENMDLAALEPVMPWLIAFGAYVLVLIGLAIAGLVLLCLNKRKVSFAPAEMELPKGTRIKTAYVNAGMILLTIGCMALIVASVIQL